MLIQCFTGGSVAHATTPVVTKVRVTQRPGTKFVDIHYDVTGATNDRVQVSVAVSTNGGLNYSLPATSFSGAGYGNGVVPGSNQHIVWDAGADWNGNHSANVSFRVTASDNSAPSAMAFIPAGWFQMGDTFNDFPVQWNWGVNPEVPAHNVYVSPFYLEQYEVTKALWDEVHDWATNHGYSFEYEDDTNSIVAARAPNHPITGVSWLGAVKWCNARSEMAGQTPAYYTNEEHTVVYRSGDVELQKAFVDWYAGYRLPTEAEWEKAARGGVNGRRFAWSDTDTIDHTRANYVSATNSWNYDASQTPGYHPEGWNGETNTWPGTTPTGHFAPNGYGLYDMTGNVREWCWNWSPFGFGEAIPYGNSRETDPRGPDSGFGLPYARAVRGGSWIYEALYARCAYRDGSDQRYGGYDIGFRCLLPGGLPNSKVTAVDTRDLLVTVSGRVRSAQTELPLANAQVTLGGRSVLTGPDGLFSIPDVTLSDGNTLSIHSPGFSTVSQIAPVPVGSVQMNLQDTQLKLAIVSNRPVVTDLVAAYDGIFISGVSFRNQYGALVDWNGFTPDRVEYYINNTNSPPFRTVAWSSGMAPMDFEMSQSFSGSYTPGANRILAVAIGQLGQRSSPYTRAIVMIPPPQGLKLIPLEWDPLFDGGWYDPSVLRFRVEIPPQGLFAGMGMPMPLLNTLGLNLSGEYKLTYSLATGSWEIGPEAPAPAGTRRLRPASFDWALWSSPISGAAIASGVASPQRGFELDQTYVILSLAGQKHIFSIHFTDWIPGGAAVNDALDAFKDVGLDLNNVQRIDINGLFKLNADLMWSCRSGSFTEAVVTPSGGVQAVYGPDFWLASLEADVTGWLNFPVRVTSPQAWKVTGEVSFGLSIYVWQLVDDSWRWVLLSGDIASSGNWDLAQTIRVPVVGADGTPGMLEGVLLAAKKQNYPRPMERDYLNAGLAEFVAWDAAAERPASATLASVLEDFRQISRAPVKGSVGWKSPVRVECDGPWPEPQFDGPLGETNQVDLTLLQNVFPRSSPAMAAHGQELMLLFVTDSGAANSSQFTDIGWTHWDGTNWSVPVAIRTNVQGEFSPQVKYDGNGDAIAVWQRIADPDFTNVSLTAEASLMEIVWSRWSATNGTWSDPVALTENDHLDNLPMLCGPMANGNVLLVWTENQANLLLGTNGPGADTVWWCEWNAAARSWSAPQILADGLTYRLSQSLAGAGQTAVYAWSQDLDGLIANDTDQEVFYAICTNGSWGAPVQFTPTGVANKNVRAAISATGDIYLLWESDLNLVMNCNFSGTNRLVRSAARTVGFADYALTLGPAANLVLLWQGMSTNGSDTYFAVYDPVADTWGKDDRLCQDPALERSVFPVWDDVGNLTLAYSKVQLIHTNKTIELEGGGQITLTNVPEWGRVDLVVTKRALVKDLAIEPGDFVVTGVNYLPGDPLDLMAVVHNRGNVAMSNVVVSFYNGNPDAGGLLLTNVIIPGWFEGGATNTATAMWQVPEPASPHVLYAVVNHEGRASEFNEANNAQSVSIGGTDLMTTLVSYQAETNGAVRVLSQVRNLGAPKATNSVLAIRREGQTNTPLATVAVPALEPGQLAQVALDLPVGTQPEGSAIYRLFGDDTHRNNDANPANNTVAFVVNLSLDADGDGMPDWYENLYPFLNPNNAADAQQDYDGDGLSNLAEYLAGTASDNPQSYLHLTSILVGGASGVQITWGSATNKFYTVQRTPVLGRGNVFTNLAEHLPATPPENVYRDQTATNASAFFYRVLVE